MVNSHVEIDYDETHDLDLFPEEFVKTKIVKTIDRDAIGVHLKAGKQAINLGETSRTR